MVEQAMGWLDEIRQRDGIEKWLELVETLRTVTEGKVRFPWVSSCVSSLKLFPAVLGDAARACYSPARAIQRVPRTEPNKDVAPRARVHDQGV
jgi:hypothetical protein